MVTSLSLSPSLPLSLPPLSSLSPSPLVSYEHDDHIGARVLSGVLKPRGEVLKRVSSKNGNRNGNTLLTIRRFKTGKQFTITNYHYHLESYILSISTKIHLRPHPVYLYMYTLYVSRTQS
jgi:hypothetical protein